MLILKIESSPGPFYCPYLFNESN